MADATFLDRFTPHQFSQRTQQQSVNDLPSVFTASGSSNHNFASTKLPKEQVKHFRAWVYVAIRRILDKVSEVRPYVGQRVTPTTNQHTFKVPYRHRQYLWEKHGGRVLQSVEEDLEPIGDQHPLMRLINRPNSEDTWEEFIQETVLFLKLTGMFYWWAVPSIGGEIAELWTVPTQWVEMDFAKSGELRAYKVQREGAIKPEIIPPEEMIVARDKSPRSKLLGWGPLHAGSTWVDNADSIERSRWHSFENGSNPDWLILLGESYENPEKDTITAIKERFIQRSSGVRRTGEPVVVPPGVQMERARLAPNEMDYGTSGDRVRDAILALFGVPPVVAGVTSDYNRATSEAAFAVFCEVTMNPLFRFIAGVLNESVVPRFDPSGSLKACYMDCKPADPELELRQDELDSRVGAVTPDEIRMKRGRTPMGTPAYQSGYAPQGMVPLDDSLTGSLDIEEPEELELDDDEQDDE